jgi:hypothetical protein
VEELKAEKQVKQKDMFHSFPSSDMGMAAGYFKETAIKTNTCRQHKRLFRNKQRAGK